MASLVKEDTLPFQLWPLEIDKQRHSKTRSLQIVNALRQMLVGEVVDVFSDLFFNTRSATYSPTYCLL